MKNDNYEQLKKLINKSSISTDEKDKILSIVNDLEIEFNRLKKSTDMQIEELEQEKEILLKHFIEKDTELNEIAHEYNKLKTESEKRNILARIKRKIQNTFRKNVK